MHAGTDTQLLSLSILSFWFISCKHTPFFPLLLILVGPDFHYTIAYLTPIFSLLYLHKLTESLSYCSSELPKILKEGLIQISSMEPDGN